jgi:hypothetical protein
LYVEEAHGDLIFAGARPTASCAPLIGCTHAHVQKAFSSPL